jgi:hypothetical protein
MKIQERSYAIVACVLVSALIFSSVMGFSDSVSGIVNASTTIDDYGDLLQYEWPQIHGDSGFTRFSEGPAPEAPDILWKTTIMGIESYVTAFNGKVFVTTTTNVIALNKDTGTIIWNTTLPDPQRWPAVFNTVLKQKLEKFYGQAKNFPPKCPIGPKVYIVQKKNFSTLRVNRRFKLGTSLIHQNHPHGHGKPTSPAAQLLERVYNMAMEKCSPDHLNLTKWP